MMSDMPDKELHELHQNLLENEPDPNNELEGVCYAIALKNVENEIRRRMEEGRKWL